MLCMYSCFMIGEALCVCVMYVCMLYIYIWRVSVCKYVCSMYGEAQLRLSCCVHAILTAQQFSPPLSPSPSLSVRHGHRGAARVEHRQARSAV